MKLADGSRMTLGERQEPTGGTRVVRTAPPARPAFVDGDMICEPVWYPHKDAASLLPEFVGQSVSAECRVRHRANGAR